MSINNLNPRKLYIGNIPSQYTEADVVKDFSPFGHIEQVEFKGRFCFVEYNSSSCVADALSNLGGMVRHGERLVVKAYRHVPSRHHLQAAHHAAFHDRGVGQSKRTSFRVALMIEQAGRILRISGGKTIEAIVWRPNGVTHVTCVFRLSVVGEVNYADVLRGPNGEKKGLLEFFDETSMDLALRQLSGQNLLGATVEVIPTSLMNHHDHPEEPGYGGSASSGAFHGWGGRQPRHPPRERTEPKTVMSGRPATVSRSPPPLCGRLEESRVMPFGDKPRGEFRKVNPRHDPAPLPSRQPGGGDHPMYGPAPLPGSPRCMARHTRFRDESRRPYGTPHAEEAVYAPPYRPRESFHRRSFETHRGMAALPERRDMFVSRRRSRSLRTPRDLPKRNSYWGRASPSQEDCRRHTFGRPRPFDMTRHRGYGRSEMYSKDYMPREQINTTPHHHPHPVSELPSHDYSKPTHSMNYLPNGPPRHSRAMYSPRLEGGENPPSGPLAPHVPHRRYLDSFPDPSFPRNSRAHPGSPHHGHVPMLHPNKYMLSTTKPR